MYHLNAPANETNGSSFHNDPDFCSECGAILSIDHNNINTECKVCDHKTSLQGVIGVQTCYTIDFTPMGYYSNLQKQKKKHQKLESSDADGQMDSDRECSKCGNRGMIYSAMQLRSADEGQTVFYYCPKCKHREVEES